MKKLEVHFTRRPGDSLHVGTLAEDRGRVYFEYATEFLSTGLNLSLSVLATGGNGLTISIIPVNLGKRDNAACRAVIAAMDKSLKQTFGSRLKTNP